VNRCCGLSFGMCRQDNADTADEPLYNTNDVSIISTTFAQNESANRLEGTKLRKGTKRRVETRSQINIKNRKRASKREEEKTHRIRCRNYSIIYIPLIRRRVPTQIITHDANSVLCDANWPILHLLHPALMRSTKAWINAVRRAVR